MLGILNTNTKVSVCGDIHINLRAVDLIAWETDRVLQLFTLLANNDSDVIILSGDVFDKPIATLAEVGLFFEGVALLREQGKEVYVIDGNHEVIDDIHTTFHYLPKYWFTHVTSGFFETSHTYLWLVGHPLIGSLTKPNFPIITDKKNILISHYRSDLGFVEAEVDNDIISDVFDDTVLSDIHYKFSPKENIRYTSSPYSIHYVPTKEYGYTTITFSSEGYTIEDKKLDLPSKIKLSCTLETLNKTLEEVDTKHLYKVEVRGEATTEALALLGKYHNIKSFSFSSPYIEVEDLVDDISTYEEGSLKDLVRTVLPTDLSEGELHRVHEIIEEEL